MGTALKKAGKDRAKDQDQDTSAFNSCETSNSEQAQNMSVPEDGGMCPADPLETMRQAIADGDPDGAWGAYGMLSADDQVTFFGDRDLQHSLLACVYPASSASRVDQILFDLCLITKAQLSLVDQAGILDPELLNHLLNCGSWTIDDQEILAQDADSMAIIQAVAVGEDPHHVLALLAATPERFTGVCYTPGALAEWCNQDFETLKRVIAEVPDLAGWAMAFEQNGAWVEQLRLAADPTTGDWRTTVVDMGLFTWIVDNAAKPLAEEEHVTGLYNLIADGDGLTLEEQYSAFDCIYGPDLLARSGDDWERSRGTADSGGVTGDLDFVYHANDPDRTAMGMFFQQFRQMPRTHIQLAEQILHTDYFAKRWTHPTGVERYLDDSNLFVTPNPADFTAAPHFDLGTSYYTSENYILMRSLDSNGTPDTTVVPDVGEGTERTPLAVNRERSGQDDEEENPTMTIFQNHATHEVGHAVGNRPLNVAPANGNTPDEMTRTEAGWEQAGDAETYARNLDFAAGMDTTNYTIQDSSGAVSVDVTGADVRTFLVGIVEQGLGSSIAQGTPLVDSSDATKFANVADALEAISNHNALKTTLLVRTVFGLKDSFPGNSYIFPFGLGSSVTDVHFFATRWGNQWVKYDKDAWDDKPSHYAVSSYKEMFAEIYTVHYTGGTVPDGFSDLFAALDSADPADFGDIGTGTSTPGAESGASGESVDLATAARSPVPGDRPLA